MQLDQVSLAPNGCSEECRALESRLLAMPEVKAVKIGAPYAYSETGEHYDLFRFTHGRTEADAIYGIEVEIAEYIRERSGTLYWRRRPETELSPGSGRWIASARLLMTEKPEIYLYDPGRAAPGQFDDRPCPTCGGLWRLPSGFMPRTADAA